LETTKKQFESAENKMNELLALATKKGALICSPKKKVQTLKNTHK
jgi:hypothetical protein